MELEQPQAKRLSRGIHDRRRTVSGPIPQYLQTGQEESDPSDEEGVTAFPAWEVTDTIDDGVPDGGSAALEASRSLRPGKSIAHRRTISGGSIFTKFNSLLRSSSDGGQKESGTTRGSKSGRLGGEEVVQTPIISKEHLEDTSMAASRLPAKARKRKGSLRKTALLGGRRAALEGRERRNSLLQKIMTPRDAVDIADAVDTQSMAKDNDSGSIHDPLQSDASISSERQSIDSVDNDDTDSIASTTSSAPRLSLVTDTAHAHPPRQSMDSIGSPVDLLSATSQVSYTSYGSTTDDDDVLTFHRPAPDLGATSRESLSLKMPSSTASTSYFPSVSDVSSVPRRRGGVKKSRSSPLSHNITDTLSSYPVEPEPHDYTETEYWGWIILFVTWLTFTVGTGSCLEIWSWAWDVGQTPYAPPELEDDPTLPIVGYYPALIVLTGVVAWVWITVAWVGMKYFRHAKMEV